MRAPLLARLGFLACGAVFPSRPVVQRRLAAPCVLPCSFPCFCCLVCTVKIEVDSINGITSDFFRVFEILSTDWSRRPLRGDRHTLPRLASVMAFRLGAGWASDCRVQPRQTDAVDPRRFVTRGANGCKAEGFSRDREFYINESHSGIESPRRHLGAEHLSSW